MSDKIKVLYSEEEIEARIKEMADRITEEYAGEEVYFACTLRGAVFFACELAKRIPLDIKMDFIQVSSYGNSTQSSGVINMKKDLEDSIEGKHVIVIEDIVDTGRTLSYLLELLKDRKPKSLKLCSLLDKPERRISDVQADYVGFTIPDLFVVGYGLDYAQKYRNLPYIGVVETEG